MPMFPEIKHSGQLPTEGSSYERDHLDFKQQISTRPFEIGKDIAAFANSFGGVILIGAEDDSDRLKQYVPMSKPQADAARKTIANALKDRCFPDPRCEVETIPRDHGFVIAVNVWPLPDQLVGVRAPTDPAEKKIPPEAYVFPIRKHTGTEYLRPQELAPLMLPHLRHMAIALESVPKPERERIEMWWRVADSASTARLLVSYEDVDIYTARATFLVSDDSTVFRRYQTKQLILPLDAIGGVQPIGKEVWRVSLRGALERLANGLFQWIPDPSAGSRR
jgi:hypothetical protein